MHVCVYYVCHTHTRTYVVPHRELCGHLPTGAFVLPPAPLLPDAGDQHAASFRRLLLFRSNELEETYFRMKQSARSLCRQCAPPPRLPPSPTFCAVCTRGGRSSAPALQPRPLSDVASETDTSGGSRATYFLRVYQSVPLKVRLGAGFMSVSERFLCLSIFVWCEDLWSKSLISLPL